jgi:hypothetical protein
MAVYVSGSEPMIQEAAGGATSTSLSVFGWILDITTLTTLIVGAVGGGWAMFRYFEERRGDREQRAADLQQRRDEQHWRAIKAAKDLVDELLNDSSAKTAMQMLDSWDRSYEIAPGVREVISVNDWLASLRAAPDRATDPAGTFVRESFDALFYRMAMLEHYIDNGFVEFRDVVFPLEYYVLLLAEDKSVHDSYLTHFHMLKTRAFLGRFDEWKHPSSVQLESVARGTATLP